MKALLLAALLAQTSPEVCCRVATDPAGPCVPCGDAPLAERPAMELTAGEVVPFDGVCMTHGKSIEVGKRLASCEASLAVVETKTLISTPVLVAGVVGIVLVAFAAGAATAYAVKRP